MFGNKIDPIATLWSSQNSAAQVFMLDGWLDRFEPMTFSNVVNVWPAPSFYLIVFMLQFTIRITIGPNYLSATDVFCLYFK